MESQGIVFDNTNIMNVKLIDESPYKDGRIEYFTDVCKVLANQFMSCLIFGKEKDGVGGYFTKKGFLPRIVLPASCATYGEDWIKFNDDEQFAIFVHESSHFLQFVKDKGKYITPSLAEKPAAKFADEFGFGQNKIVDLEYEAGYRSLRSKHLYELYAEDDRTVLETNLINIINYIDIENLDELKEPFKDNKEGWKEHRKKLVDDWLKRIEYWADLADYKTKL